MAKNSNKIISDVLNKRAKKKLKEINSGHTCEPTAQPINTGKYVTLAKDIAELINKASIENDSNTPDYILGEYLVNCLLIYNTTIKNRTQHANSELVTQFSKFQPPNPPPHPKLREQRF